MEDPFIREHIEELLHNIRTQVLIKLIRPYTRVRIIFIAQVQMYLYMCNNIHVCILLLTNLCNVVCMWLRGIFTLLNEVVRGDVTLEFLGQVRGQR